MLLPLIGTLLITKYLVINLTKHVQVLCIGNYKMLMIDTKEYLNNFLKCVLFMTWKTPYKKGINYHKMIYKFKAPAIKIPESFMFL